MFDEKLKGLLLTFANLFRDLVKAHVHTAKAGLVAQIIGVQGARNAFKGFAARRIMTAAVAVAAEQAAVATAAVPYTMPGAFSMPVVLLCEGSGTVPVFHYR